MNETRAREIATRIVELYNKGKNQEALNLLHLSSWSLPEKTTNYLKKVMGREDPAKLMKEAAKTFGGGIITNKLGEVIYVEKENKNMQNVRKEKGNQAGLDL